MKIVMETSPRGPVRGPPRTVGGAASAMRSASAVVSCFMTEKRFYTGRATGNNKKDEPPGGRGRWTSSGRRNIFYGLVSDPVVQIENLRKSFGPVAALDGVSFEVGQGKVFGLLGPNGAGKTTTIKVLTTLVEPDGGRAFVAGHSVLEDPVAVRRLIGYVPQELTVDPYLTAREHLRYYADLYHLSAGEREASVRGVLQLVGLVGAEDRRVKTFSGGMKKKLDLACGLVHHPPLILLDEPSLGLDVQVRREVWNYILQLKEQGTTVLLCTNYMDEAERLCDELAIIDKGKIAATGTPTSLRDELRRDVVIIQADPTQHYDQEKLGALERAMERLPMVKQAVLDGSEIRLYVEQNETALPQILEAARGLEVAVHSITQSRPGLDEVFLHHTGHPLTLS